MVVQKGQGGGCEKMGGGTFWNSNVVKPRNNAKEKLAAQTDPAQRGEKRQWVENLSKKEGVRGKKRKQLTGEAKQQAGRFAKRGCGHKRGGGGLRSECTGRREISFGGSGREKGSENEDS